MKVISKVDELQRELATIKTEKIGFVPTMGALHDGHVSLVKKARTECGTVVVSIFVNPTQFNDKGDLERYPRTPEADHALLERSGVDIIFAPTVAEVYPAEMASPTYDFGQLDKVMEGACRPGHFAGVAQVVGRLFDIVKPGRAYFGEKDFQQLAIIRDMVRLDKSAVVIVGCPIIRGADGLALSSRNALLSAEQHIAATTIYKVLNQAAEKEGNPRQIERWATQQININPMLEVEYLQIVDPFSLQKVDNLEKCAQICTAVYCGKVRLIDNIQCK